MTDTPAIAVVDDPTHSKYAATLDGERAGVIVYERHDGTIDLQHTIVRPEAEGRGVGSTMIRFALDAARASGEKVIPSCPFVKAFLRDHDEYADVVA